MGVGEFLSSKATNEWILNERRREEWEMENYPEGEIREVCPVGCELRSGLDCPRKLNPSLQMIEIYENKGMSKEDATLVISVMSKYKDFFVDIMMQQELELQVPEDDHVQESMREGFIMFLSFAAFGAMPLLGYVIIPVSFPDLGEEKLFQAACAVTGFVLFLLGSIKSKFA
jgi:DNA damage-binding protein 1